MKTKYSKWQSGTIPPEVEGTYERRPKNWESSDGLSVFMTNGLWYVRNDNDVFVLSVYQKQNGDTWEWRGIIE